MAKKVSRHGHNVPWGAKLPPTEDHCSSVSFHTLSLDDYAIYWGGAQSSLNTMGLGAPLAVEAHLLSQGRPLGEVHLTLPF